MTRFFESNAFLLAAGLRLFTEAFDLAAFRGTARVAFALPGFALAGLRFAAERGVATRLPAREPERLRLLVTALMEAQFEGNVEYEPCEDALAE